MGQTVLVIKYMIPHYPENFGVNWGVANVIQSSESTTTSYRLLSEGRLIM